MKRLLFLISFLAITGTVKAQWLVVEKEAGEPVSMALAELKQITFSGKTVNIEQTDGTRHSATMGEIGRIYIEQSQSIDEVGQLGDNLVEYLSFDEIAINSESGSMVAIYNLTGAQLLTKRIDAQGEPISIANLPQGIYIVKANEKTTKIIKR